MMDPPAPNRKRRRSPVLGSLKSPFVYVPGDGTKVGRFVPRGSGAQYCFPDQPPPPPGYEHRRRFIISSRRNPFVLSPESLCGVGTYSLAEIDLFCASFPFGFSRLCCLICLKPSYLPVDTWCSLGFIYIFIKEGRGYMFTAAVAGEETWDLQKGGKQKET
jgi:hypothetical protein